MVLLAGLVLQHSADGLALLDCQDVLEVEHGLFPVRVLCVGASGESDGLVAGSELDIEPGNDGVDEVATTHLELVRQMECEIGDCAGVEIEGDDWRWISDDGLDVNGVDERLRHGGGLERSVVEAPDVIPDCEN